MSEYKTKFTRSPDCDYKYATKNIFVEKYYLVKHV